MSKQYTYITIESYNHYEIQQFLNLKTRNCGLLTELEEKIELIKKKRPATKKEKEQKQIEENAAKKQKKSIENILSKEVEFLTKQGTVLLQKRSIIQKGQESQQTIIGAVAIINFEKLLYHISERAEQNKKLPEKSTETASMLEIILRNPWKSMQLPLKGFGHKNMTYLELITDKTATSKESDRLLQKGKNIISPSNAPIITYEPLVKLSKVDDKSKYEVENNYKRFLDTGFCLTGVLENNEKHYLQFISAKKHQKIYLNGSPRPLHA